MAGRWPAAHFEAEQHDTYSRARPLIVAAVAAYACVTLCSDHSLQPTTADARTPANATIVFAARDNGARMYLFYAFPACLLRLHAMAATLLFSLALAQKEWVRRVGRAPAARTRAVFLKRHRTVGYVVLVLSVVMAGAGFMLAPASAMPYFSGFIYVFFLPWIVLGAGVFWTARYGAITLHRIFGNLLVKACLSVPLARSLTPLLSWFSFNDTNAYYCSIALAAAFTSIWAVYDVVCAIRTQSP